MTTAELSGFKDKLKAEGIVFCYYGPVSQGLIEEIGHVIRKKMQIEDAASSMIRRIFAIFVEQVQNIMNYSAETRPDDTGSSELRSGVVVIGREDGGFFVHCGNLIDACDEPRLRESLKQIEGKDRAALKLLYKEKLKSGGAVESGKGAGLGIIDIARNASSPLEYDLGRVDDEHLFFSSKVIIREER